MKSLNFSLCKAGYCSHPEVVTIRGGSIKSCQFPSAFGVFEHPQEGIILYDTGYHPRYNEQKKVFPEGIYPRLIPAFLKEEDTALNQLKSLGKSADDVSWIVISHFHGDHIAGLLDFPKAKLLCLKSAFDSSFYQSRFQNLLNGFLPNLIPSDFLNRVIWIDDQPQFQKTNELNLSYPSFDIFRDGSMGAIELPGHKHGQVGLYFQDSYHGACLMVADAAWSAAAITEYRPPSPLALTIMDDRKQYLKTLKELNSLSHRRPDLNFIPSHCEKTFNKMNRKAV